MPLLINRAPKRRRKTRSDFVAVGEEAWVVLVLLAGERRGEAEAARGAAVGARAPEEGAAGREGAQTDRNFKAVHRCRPEAVQI